METVDPDDMRLTQGVIRDKLFDPDPLHDLLMSHTYPAQIYSDICPFEFAAAFRQLSRNPASKGCQRNLLAMLEKIDLRRQQHHVLQQIGDQFNIKNVAWIQPVGLVDSFEKIANLRH